MESKPQNHLGLYIYNFLDRTNTTLAQLTKLSGLPRSYVNLYVFGNSHPQPKQFIRLADTMADIANMPEASIIIRMMQAVRDDLNCKPFPPRRRCLKD